MQNIAHAIVIILSCILILSSAKRSAGDLYRDKKIPIFYYTNKLFADAKDSLQSRVTSLRGNVAPPNSTMQFLNFCFRHQTFMRHRTIRRGRKNLPRNYQGPPCQSSLRMPQGGRGRSRVRRWKEKERRGVSRPKFKGRENLDRQSAAGTKQVPVRGQTLVLSLYISLMPRSLYLRQFPTHGIQSRTSLITLRATRKR